MATLSRSIYNFNHQQAEGLAGGSRRHSAQTGTNSSLWHYPAFGAFF